MHLRRRSIQLVLFITAHPRAALASATILAVACIIAAVGWLTLSTNQNELFSPSVPAFRDYLDFIEHFPENEAIYVMLEPADPASPIPAQRWTDAADAIAARLSDLPDHVRVVDHRIDLDEVGAQGILFQPPGDLSQDLEDVRTFLPLVRLWAEAPDLTVSVLGSSPLERFLGVLSIPAQGVRAADVALPFARDWTRLITTNDESWSDPLGFAPDDARARGYYVTTDRTDPDTPLLLIRVYPNATYNGLTAITRTVEAIRTTALDAAAGYPEFTVGVTGRPVLESDQMRTTDRDTKRAEIIALITVFIGLVLLLRSLWLALAAEISLGFGIVWTFGFATLALGRLNLLSIVFLIALIGIGMDSLIQILARYRAVSRPGRSRRAVWARVYGQVGPPVATACLGAAAAFYVSIFTDFRGAAELGIVAGTGLLLCLVSTYVVLPSLLTLRPGKTTPPPVPSNADRRRPPLFLPILWFILLLIGAPFMLQARFESGLLDLQSKNLDSARLVRKLETWYLVVLTDDADTQRLAHDLLADAPLVQSIDGLVTADDNAAHLADNPLAAITWTPPTPLQPDDIPALRIRALQAADSYQQAAETMDDSRRDLVIAAAAALRDFADALADTPPDRAAAALTTWQEEFIRSSRAVIERFDPVDLDMRTLPHALRAHYADTDRRLALYVYPAADLWNDANLTTFVEDVERRLAPLGDRVTVTGIASNIYHTTRSIRSSFLWATGYALAFILLIVLVDLRSLRLTLAATSVLALGLPMLVAIMSAFGVSWNFANFFALPIIIGAGHEYGVFLVHRYKEARDNPNRAWVGWDSADRALLLCAFVTFSSFGFLGVLAHHQGLRSLGIVMAVGTACIYAATLTVLRPILLRTLARRQRSAT